MAVSCPSLLAQVSSTGAQAGAELAEEMVESAETNGWTILLLLAALAGLVALVAIAIKFHMDTN